MSAEPEPEGAGHTPEPAVKESLTVAHVPSPDADGGGGGVVGRAAGQTVVDAAALSRMAGRLRDAEHKARQYDSVVEALKPADGGRYRNDTIESLLRRLRDAARLAAVEAENQRLKALVDKLPVTADGVPIVSGDRVWFIDERHAVSGIVSRVKPGRKDRDVRFAKPFPSSPIYGLAMETTAVPISQVYSTEAAALSSSSPSGAADKQGEAPESTTQEPSAKGGE